MWLEHWHEKEEFTDLDEFLHDGSVGYVGDEFFRDTLKVEECVEFDKVLTCDYCNLTSQE